MVKEGAFKGKNLISKIYCWSAIIFYFMLPFILGLLEPNEKGIIPAENYAIFGIIMAVIAFYVIITGWMSEHWLRLKERYFSNQRVLTGDKDDGTGKGGDYEFLIKDMWRFDEVSENVEELTVKSEEEMYKLELKELKRLEDRSRDL